MLALKEKDLPKFKRFVMPVLAVIACLFMIVAACFAHKIAVLWYLITFAVIMLIGTFFYKK